ncbi:acyl-CoA synthetase (AMP-forming)/AMP-acid ligase II [Corynebacterium uterequi]|uniref:Acyl-CoA synthetase (AMP-forming)/AMP-acid ligase II n=2 Tax=Corynebacterium uterequi TaxID=1072256 RepID=A0A0G3HBM1_9CORY|nr:acyl-CoA synthetase (AMP-forming)/AMP-acid ligase II [Corynebacterium uterequi]
MPLGSPYPDITIPDLSVTEFVFGSVDPADAHRPAIIDSGSTITFAELAEQVEYCAGALHRRGVRRGDVVALHCPNSTTFAVAFFAVLRLGAVVTTIGTLATAEDVAYQIRESGAAMLLTTSSIGWAGAVGAGQAGLSDENIVGLTGAHGLSALVAERHSAPEVSISPEDVAVLPFSSGTTGRPKAVVLTHRNLVANVLQATVALGDTFTREHPVATALPFFHIYGMSTMLIHMLYRRITQVTFASFDLTAFLYLIEKHRINFAFIAPPIAVALAKHPMVDRFDLSSLEVVLSGAAPLQEELAAAVRDRLGCVMAQGFGMTESSPVTHARMDHSRPLESIGPAAPNTEFRLVDVGVPGEPEIPLPTSGRSTPGELQVRGPQVMRGYVNNPEATAAAFVDGWLRTGDMAQVDAEGNLFIVDRIKELIKYKGYQVPPAEIEALLLEHPDIQDAACVGVRRGDGEEVPKAFVVRRSGATLTEQEVMAFVADRVAPYKKVREVEFCASIPKSATGKILRRLLR